MYCTQVVLPECPVEYSIYGYYPSVPANAFLAAIFGILFIPNLIFGIYSKTYTYALALCLGCVTETIGYVGRILLHNNPFSTTGFQMQICCLILGPAFNSAAIYLTLKHIVIAFGEQYSLIKPNWYTYIFITGDLISLVLQAVGGGMAATAGENVKMRDLGTDIMMAGISWQVVTLFAFATCASLYVWKRSRAVKQGQALDSSASTTLRGTKFRLFAFGIVTAFITVFGRCVYRLAEMRGGWANPIMRDESSYIACEGAFIAYATLVQTVFHPGYCFPQLNGKGSKTVAVEEEKGAAGRP